MKEQNILFGTVLFGIGIYGGLEQYITLKIALIFLLITILLSSIFWYKKIPQQYFMIAIGSAILCCGLIAGCNGVREQTLVVQNYYGKYVRLEGRVDINSVKENNYGNSFLLDCFWLTEGERVHPVSAKIRVLTNIKQERNKWCGNAVVTGVLQPITGFSNPGSMDMEAWQSMQGIRGRIKANESDVLLERDETWYERFILFSINLRQKIQESIPGQAGAVLAGMTLGGYDGLDENTRMTFADTGLAHLLSVSGTHIALLAGFLLVLGGSKPSKRTLFVVISILVLYAGLCGFKAPVLRALLMSIAILYGNHSDRKSERSNIFCAVLVLLLVYEPFWLLDIGFQLSFLTTAGLLYLYPQLAEFCRWCLPSAVADTIAVTLTAQLTALPFLIAYFHQVSLASLVANLVLVPFLEAIMVMALVGLALEPVLGMSFLKLAGWLMIPILTCIEYLSLLPWAVITVGAWPILAGGIYYLLLVVWLTDSNWNDFSSVERRNLLILCCVALVVIGSYEKYKLQPLTVHFIDVGQGDAALLISPQGKTILIDTGGLKGDFDTGNRIVLPYLRYLGIRKLDLLLLSHGDHDHAGGAVAIAKKLMPQQILLPQEAVSQDLVKLAKIVDSQRFCYAEAGAVYNIGDCSIEMISAPTEAVEGNEQSLIVRIVCAEHSVVFTGDASEDAELAAATVIQSADVLKVSHHGSNYSSSTAFLTAVQPQAAIISVGAGNSYGHPGQETLQRLEACGIAIYRTDILGAIKVVFDEVGTKCYSYRYQKRFF